LAVVLADPCKTPDCNASTKAPLIGVPSLAFETVPEMAPALTVTLKAPLVAPVSPMEEAVNVYKSPVWLILRSLKAATPDEAFFVVVPDRVPPPGLFPMAIVIEAVDEVMVLPRLSWTLTVGGPGIELLTVTFPGCVVKASLAAAPAVMSNAVLVAPVSPVAVAVNM
jgi:hypothetical protein